ncbi:helicase associated domain-containing protein [Kitasatospora sp. NPDC001683]
MGVKIDNRATVASESHDANARCDGLVDWATLPVDTVFEGEQLGRWMMAQRAGFAELDQEQQDLLTAIGIAEDQELAAALAAAAARSKVSRTDRFRRARIWPAALPASN